MKRFSKNIGIYLIIFGLVLAMAWFYNKTPNEEIKEVDYTEFVQYLKAGDVDELNVDNNENAHDGHLERREEDQGQLHSGRL